MTRAKDISKIVTDANFSGTLDVTGVVTANAGITIDNITIDGTEIDLSSGDLTIDVASDLIIDVDDGRVFLKDGGTTFGRLANNSTNFDIVSVAQDKDIIFKGNDGGSEITALTLDMSDAGTAIFNHDLKVADNNNMQFGSGADLMLSSDGTNGTIATLNGDLTLDVQGTIILDGDEAGATVHLKDDGVHWGSIFRSDSNFNIKSEASDKDIVFFGNDAGSTITALTLDMSDAGTATFNNGIKVGDGHPNNIGQVKSTSTVSLADDASITIQQVSAGSQVVCIYESSQGAWAIYAVGYGVSSILAEYAAGTTDFVVGDTDGKACIITSNHTTTFKNRRGATSSYRISSMGVGDFTG